ncbi:MAG: hypothetical protein Q8S36_04135 [Sulfuricurvum sp.]|nr:hypothetical protein [Sulfuricurvum sp.]
MIKTVWLLCICTLLASAIESQSTYENSNFTLSSALNGNGHQTLYNYNRFRVNEQIRDGQWFAVAIGDIENILGRELIQSNAYKIASAVTTDTPFSTQTKTYDYDEGQMYAQLYRLYAGYADEKHTVSLGLQKVSMGVGRIWNPTDLFNPKNPLALEPDEVYGSFALSYTYAFGSLSQITAVAAQRADKSFKYAGRAKGYLGMADAAIDVVSADDVSMIGYELEGELLETGVELRSEGGWFDDKVLDRKFIQGLIGADYGFENSFMLIGEWLHTSRTFEQELRFRIPSGALSNLVRSKDYVAISCGFQFDPLLYGTLSTILNAHDGSFYTGPVLRYSLEDDMLLGLGMMFYEGKSGSEFGALGQTYYVNFKITF